MKFIPWLAVAVQACPYLVEVFPDPVDVPDREGEFVEVRLDEGFSADSLRFFLDGNAALALPYPEGSRLVLVHDSAYCPAREGLACALFKQSLPNSRESTWRLEAGSCVDSALLPLPKAGMAFQRRAETDDWVLSAATPGFANAEYERGIADCAIASFSVTAEGGAPEATFRVEGFVEGCDSAVLQVRFSDLSTGGEFRDSVEGPGKFSFRLAARGSGWLRMALPEDDCPLNNEIDTLLVLPESPPLYISEVHHCPQEPVPEWVEVYNASRYPMPLSRFRFCGRGGFFGDVPDSIPPYRAFLVTKDSLGLREHLGFEDVPVVQVSMGYLNNTSGSLFLCMDSSAIDSVSWDRSTVECPSGFNPRSSRGDDTPGFVRHTADEPRDPFSMVLSNRIVRMEGAPLRVRLEGEGAVQVRLLDSSSREVWRTGVESRLSQWIEVPVQRLGTRGVNYVAARLGDFEKVVGIVLRP